MKSPLLVTGSHNSGTTWVGRILAFSDELGYIYEPFNPGWKTPGIKGAQFEHYYTYIAAHNQHRYQAGIRQTLDYQYDLLEGVRKGRDPRWMGRVKAAVKDWDYYRRCRLQRRRPLLKDPIALMSAEWLASVFDMRIIVLIRHPAAFVHSIKAKGWRQPCKSLLSQDELMQERLSAFQKDLERYRDSEHSLVDEASFMWKVLHTQMVSYQQRHPDWLFVRHEDLSLDPVGEFSKLFQYAGLKYTDEIVQGIKVHSGLAVNDGSNAVDPRLIRDSRANLSLWKQKLTSEEIGLVRANVKGVAEHFYSEGDWV